MKALLTLALFAGVAGGTAFANGEGQSISSTMNNYWGHVVGDGTTNDCLWMNWAIATSPSQKPFLYTYASTDGTRYGPSGGGGPRDARQTSSEGEYPCGDPSRALYGPELQIQQSLGHWLGWANTWVWCNFGPWVANGPGMDHDVQTAYAWPSLPCQDQSPAGQVDSWFFGWHSVWAGNSRVGGSTQVGVVSNWLYSYR